MTKKKNVAAHLPKKAPKKTGKAGIKPLDPVEEFDKPTKTTPPAEEKKKPRQARLPEMEDPAIEELEAKAEEYAAVRDERMALTPQEKKLKDDLLALMKANNKEVYTRDGIEVRIVHESETVKVHVKKTDENED